MAHFAKIGLNSKVISVLTVNNNDLLNADGVEDENVGIEKLTRETGWPLWVQTSYNTLAGKHYTTDPETGERTESTDQSKALRANFAGVGMTWDEDKNIFYGKQPFSSWTLNSTTGLWESPVTRPTQSQCQYDDDGTTREYEPVWDETNNRWISVVPTDTDGTFRRAWNTSTSVWDTISDYTL